MKFLSYSAMGLFALFSLSACQHQGPRKLDINGVMDRTIETMIDFVSETEEANKNASDEEIRQQFASKLHAALNSRPKVFTGRVGLQAFEDASFKGFDDRNKNNVQEENEQHLFTLELDGENERLIATDFSENTYGTSFRDGQYRGYFFVWISRSQRAAGIAPNRFAGRNIDTRMKPVRAAKLTGRGGRARSRARSGGSRSGK